MANVGIPAQPFTNSFSWRESFSQTLQEIIESVIKLRAQGKSAEDIALTLNLTLVATRYLIRQLGVEKPARAPRRGRHRPSAYENRRREVIIRRRRRQGCSNKQIAIQHKIPYETVGKYAHKLIQQGFITRDPRGNKAQLLNAEDDRVKTIIKLKKQRATLQVIGDILGVTRERARQLIVRIQTQLGTQVFEPGPDARFWTASEIKKELGLKKHDGEVGRLCIAAHIPFQRRSQAKGSPILLTNADLEQLRTYLKALPAKICYVCQNPIPAGRSKLCSDACNKKNHVAKRRQYSDQPVIPENLRGFSRELWEELHREPVKSRQEIWLGLAAAGRLSGLTHMQLIWLRTRRILTTRAGKKHWRGKPVRLYARSELLVAKRVFAKYPNRTFMRKR